MNTSSYTKRLLAATIDFSIIFSILIGSFAAILATFYLPPIQSIPLYMISCILICIAFSYPWISSIRAGKHNGQTFGKQIMNIKVVKTDMSDLTLKDMTYREMMVKPFLILLLPSLFHPLNMLILLILVLIPLFTAERISLHDKILRTVVINQER